MHAPVLSTLVLAALLCPVAAQAQDPVKVDPAHYKVVADNAAVRILRISYPPGSKSAMHSHPDAIAIPLTDSHMQFATPDGKSEARQMEKETALYTPAGTHLPSNAGKMAGEVLLVEFKGAAPGTATIPTARDNMEIKVLAEGPRAMAYRVTAAPAFTEPAGTKHAYDQVVISLADAKMSLAVDGKPAKTSWARGDAVFIGRGVAHESKNASDKPVDFIIVAIK